MCRAHILAPWRVSLPWLALLQQPDRPRGRQGAAAGGADGRVNDSLCPNAGQPEDFATVPDWLAVQRELVQALRAVGHPAGD